MFGQLWDWVSTALDTLKNNGAEQGISEASAAIALVSYAVYVTTGRISWGHFRRQRFTLAAFQTVRWGILLQGAFILIEAVAVFNGVALPVLVSELVPPAIGAAFTLATFAHVHKRGVAGEKFRLLVFAPLVSGGAIGGMNLIAKILAPLA
jgi:hypothetical protein